MTIRKSIHVNRPVERTFRLFTEAIGKWWPLKEGFSFGGSRADAIEQTPARRVGECREGTIQPRHLDGPLAHAAMRNRSVTLTQAPRAHPASCCAAPASPAISFATGGRARTRPYQACRRGCASVSRAPRFAANVTVSR